jgi:hypothetical protein
MKVEEFVGAEDRRNLELGVNRVANIPGFAKSQQIERMDDNRVAKVYRHISLHFLPQLL